MKKTRHAAARTRRRRQTATVRGQIATSDVVGAETRERVFDADSRVTPTVPDHAAAQRRLGDDRVNDLLRAGHLYDTMPLPSYRVNVVTPPPGPATTRDFPVPFPWPFAR